MEKKPKKTGKNPNPMIVTILIVFIVGSIIVDLSSSTERSASTLTNGTQTEDSTTFIGLNSTSVDYSPVGTVFCLNPNIYNSTGANVTGNYTISENSCIATLNFNRLNNTNVTANYTGITQSYIPDSAILTSLLRVGAYIIFAVIIMISLNKYI